MNLEKYLKNEPGIHLDLLKYFNKEDKIIIFDIGSCEGEDSIRYSQTFPNSTIYAFEPLEKNFHSLNENLKKYNIKNVKSYNEALSDKEGCVDFFVSSGHPDYLPKTNEWDYGNKSSSIFEPKSHQPNWMNFEKIKNIKSNTLYNFCKENNINNIDFIHMDVQGAEKLVLHGAGNYINNINMIWLEVSLVEFYKNQPLKNDILYFLKDNGFNVVKDVCSHMGGDILVKKTNL
jgi:FkbM family methyltransferase